ncbi:MAG: SPFH domain-containing protein [Eubacteriales bacterium]|nr:SPFH domain-containing protein [Eubacteriales bacterium]MDD3200289.1 SPFH domain-containing protein [Eubacteriales bacterium]MDD4630498.1 SPFH domain-containing protein [Eubacteriales bacterium]
MTDNDNLKEKQLHFKEITPRFANGMIILILNILLMLAALAGIIFGILKVSDAVGSGASGISLIVICTLYLVIIGPVLFAGLKILKPNEALVLTLFGKYHGTLKGEGFFFVNPFVTAFHPGSEPPAAASTASELAAAAGKNITVPVKKHSKIISLKTMTLNNDKQKINDELGNPIIIGIVVIWKVVNTAKAAFNVDNYTEYLSIQCDSALRNIVRLYPYDSSNEDQEKSLRGSSQEIAGKLKDEIQKSVEIAGLEIMEARITHLAYAPEIAAAMLQRQQASAIIAARQMIVESAVGMVEMALDKLSEREIVELDEERKAAMVSNLLVVLCGNKDAQPIVNSGSIY